MTQQALPARAPVPRRPAVARRHTLSLRNRLAATAAAIAIAGAGVAALAPDVSATTAAWPQRPIRLVVPVTTGGTADTVARLVADRLEVALKTPVVVDNRPGAGGMIGSEMVARAAPDGHTLLVGTSNTLTMLPHLLRNVSYDALRDFTPIVNVGRATTLVVLNASVPATNLAELVAFTRRSPQKLNFGSAGAGSSNHLTGEYLKSLAGLDIVHIPYKGSAYMMSALLAGEVHLALVTVGNALPQLNAGKLRALFVAAPRRSAQLPGVPSAPEVGLPQFDGSTWAGLVGPAGLAAEIVERLNGIVDVWLREPSVVERLLARDFTPVGGSAAEFARLIRTDHARWGEIVRRAGIAPE